MLKLDTLRITFLIVVIFSCQSSLQEKNTESGKAAVTPEDTAHIPARTTHKPEVPVADNGNSTELSFPANGKNNYTLKIVTAANNTFGYEILQEGKPLIKQLSIPGMPGNTGFKTKESAEEIGNLVIKKMENGEMPPSVTIDELTKANAIQ